MPIDPGSLDPDPIRQLGAWLADAEAAGIDLPNAFALATSDAQGTPSVRMLLLRGLDVEGLRFYTNTASRKGRDIAANSRGAAAFWWPALARQVRLAGEVRPLPRPETLGYWATRPRASQLSAWASAQGEEVASRDALEARVAEVAGRFGEGRMPLPPSWSGYLLTPEVIEFWESRADRLHDRVEFRRDPDGTWRARRLQP